MTPQDTFALGLAQSIGQHMLVWLAALLVALPALSLALMQAWQAGLKPRLRQRLGVRAPSLVFLALSVAVMALSAWLFAELAENLGAHRTVGRFDEALIATLADTLPPPVLQAFGWITHLGDAATQAAVVALGTALLWLAHRRGLALALAVAGIGVGLWIEGLKRLFERARPEHGHDIAVVASGYSFPSGHSAGAVAIYGMLAYVLLRLLPVGAARQAVAVAAPVLIVLIGVSRVALQVHWPSDVVAGFAVGLAWLAACIASVEVANARRG